MKRHLQTLLASSLVLLAAFHSPAQGTINFNSVTSPTLGIISNTLTGVTARITQGGYLFGLYFATSTNAFSGPFNPVLVVTNFGFPGSVSTADPVVLNGLATGSTFLFEVKGWSIATVNFGFPATFEEGQDYSAYVGVSPIGQVTLGGDTTVAGSIFGSTGGAVAIPILINDDPEPSTLIVGGLGAAMIVAGRRRWQKSRIGN